MKSIGLYPRVRVDTSRTSALGQAGGVLLVEALRRSGLDQGLSAGLARWRKPTAIHDPAKIICDLAVSLAVGGDCLADVGVLRSEPGVYGHVASDPTVSRTITALATDLPRVLAAVDAARAHARRRVWQLAGEHAPDHRADTSRPVIIDLDATLVTSYSDKESARPTYKRGYGFHPLCAFVDHGETGTGDHRVRHQHPHRSAPRSRAAAPTPGPCRGPHPRSQGHRIVEPALTRLRAEADLVRGRHARHRTHRLDADARLPSPPSPTVGAETAPSPAVHHPRRAGPYRTAGDAASHSQRSLGPTRRRRHPAPPRPSPSPADQNARPTRPAAPPRTVEPRPPRRHSAGLSHPPSTISSQPTSTAPEP